jgi:hypothetical protein
LLQRIVSIAAGRLDRLGSDPFDFVRTHAEWRARHQVPLVASLHAYRLAHMTYWGFTREELARQPKQKETVRALTMLSDFWIELFDLVGTVLAEAHAVEEGLVVAQSTRAYVRLIDDLLGGVEPTEAEALRLRALCGIRPGAPLALAVMRPIHSASVTPADLEVTLRSLVRLIEQSLPPALFGRLVDIRNGEVTAIVCSESDTGRTLLSTLRRSGFARRATNGSAAGVGVSLDTATIAGLPRALAEARLALEFANVGRPHLHFSDINLADYLIRHADDAAFRLIPTWAHRLASAEDSQSRALSRTIREFTDCSFNVKKTARRLDVHTNTVYFRLNRVKKLTGVDPRTFAGASLLLTSLRLLDIRANNDRDW